MSVPVSAAMHPNSHTYYNVHHRAPPPYPGNNIHNLYQPGYRQSYSGSETSADLSLSSSENLSTCARQDPQGEETTSEFPFTFDPGDSEEEYSILARLGMTPPSPSVEIKSDNSSTFYVTGNMPHSDSSGSEFSLGSDFSPDLAASRLQGAIYAITTSSNQSSNIPSFYISTANGGLYSSSPVAISSVPQANPQTCGAKIESPKVIKGTPQKCGVGAAQGVGVGVQDQSPQRLMTTASMIRNALQRTQRPQSAPASRNHSGNQRVVRETRAATPGPQPVSLTIQQQAQASQPMPLPPQYPGNSVPPSPKQTSTPLHSSLKQAHATASMSEHKNTLQEIFNKLQASNQRPDVTHLQQELQGQGQKQGQILSQGQGQSNNSPVQTQNGSPNLQQNNFQNRIAAVRSRLGGGGQQDLDHAAVATRATQMVERLAEENRALRGELEGYYKKVAKLQKFEGELQKVHEAYESLVKHSTKREQLEKMMRLRLDGEIKKLKVANKEFREQLDKALVRLQQKGLYDPKDCKVIKPDLESSVSDAMLAKLILQNEGLSSSKDRLEIEVTAQRATLEEQRTHIDILDNALTNTQTNVVKLEEEMRKKELQEAKLEELQKAFSQLQSATEKREGLELQLRNKLDEEIKSLKRQKSDTSDSKSSDLDEGIASDAEGVQPDYTQLSVDLQERDQTILVLRTDLVKCEQKFLQETALRHLAVDAASMPKDARIAALEQNCHETEKIIAEARAERLKHLEEVYQANKKSAEMEAKTKQLYIRHVEDDAKIRVLGTHLHMYQDKVKHLQAQLAEKDAMICVLQRHTSLSRTSSVSSLLSSPRHSPRPSLIPGPASGVSTRQNSHVSTDSGAFARDVKSAIYNKSNSTGGSNSPTSSCSSPSHSPSVSGRERHLQPITDTPSPLVGLENSKIGSDKVSKCLWQV